MRQAGNLAGRESGARKNSGERRRTISILTLILHITVVLMLEPVDHSIWLLPLRGETILIPGGKITSIIHGVLRSSIAHGHRDTPFLDEHKYEQYIDAHITLRACGEPPHVPRYNINQRVLTQYCCRDHAKHTRINDRIHDVPVCVCVCSARTVAVLPRECKGSCSIA